MKAKKFPRLFQSQSRRKFFYFHDIAYFFTPLFLWFHFSFNFGIRSSDFLPRILDPILNTILIQYRRSSRRFESVGFLSGSTKVGNWSDTLENFQILDIPSSLCLVGERSWSVSSRWKSFPKTEERSSENTSRGRSFKVKYGFPSVDSVKCNKTR